jgi:hypothetical protein
MAAQAPWFLWTVLTVASMAVGGAMLAVAFAVYNRGERRRQQGFEVNTTTGGQPAPVTREKETDHG